MFDELYPSTLAIWGIAATSVGSALGFMPAGRLRFSLIVAWALLPLCLMIVVAIASGLSFGAFTFGIVSLLLTLPMWAILTLLPFNIVRRVRELQAHKPD